MRFQVLFCFSEGAVMEWASVIFIERIRLHTSDLGGT